MTTATKPLPPHGDHRRYWRGCRCRSCTTAATARARQCAYLRDTGRGHLRDAAPAAQHLTRLRNAGMSTADIVTATGLGDVHLRRILGYQQHVGADTERRILAVPIPATGAVNSSCVHVPATGTVRRLRALVADGWTTEYLAQRLGWRTPYVRSVLRGQSAVEHRTAVTVNELYTELAASRPEDSDLNTGRIDRARRFATRKGWTDSAWWEDWGGIDDPEAPETEPARATPRYVVLAEDALWLRQAGWDDKQIAARLGETKDYLQKAIRHYQRQQQTREAAR